MTPPSFGDAPSVLNFRTAAILFLVLLCSSQFHIAAAGNSTGGPAAGSNIKNPDPLRWGPYITGTTCESTCIHVWTTSHLPVTLEYIQGPFCRGSWSDIHTLSSSEEELHHIFTLENLEAGSTYQYRILTCGRVYGDFSFRTYPRSGPVTFVVYGDTRDELPRISQEARHQPVAEAIAREPDVAFVIHTGDLVHDGENVTDWDRFFATGAVMLANTTFIPVMGNHEKNSTLYFEIFRTPANYTIHAGDTLIAVLDSNDWAWNTLPLQSAWLSESLSEDMPWKFIALHHPIFSSDEKHWGGFENLRREWEPVFQETGVTAVFQSHVHLYERDFADGITYITEARGGAPWYALAEQKIPEYRKSSENTLGYSLIAGEKGSPAVRLIAKTVNPGRVRGNDQIEVIEEILLYPPDTPSVSNHRSFIRSALLPLHFSELRTCLLCAFQYKGCTHPNVQYPPGCHIIPFLHPARVAIPDPVREDSV